MPRTLAVLTLTVAVSGCNALFGIDDIGSDDGVVPEDAGASTDGGETCTDITTAIPTYHSMLKPDRVVDAQFGIGADVVCGAAGCFIPVGAPSIDFGTNSGCFYLFQEAGPDIVLAPQIVCADQFMKSELGRDISAKLNDAQNALAIGVTYTGGSTIASKNLPNGILQGVNNDFGASARRAITVDFNDSVVPIQPAAIEVGIGSGVVRQYNQSEVEGGSNLADCRWIDQAAIAVDSDGDVLAVADDNPSRAALAAPGEDWRRAVPLPGVGLPDCTIGPNVTDLAVPSGAAPSFGQAIAVSRGSTSILVAVGAPGVDGRGRVYVYSSSDGFADPQVLEPPNDIGGQAFGAALAIDGDLLVVGAPLATLGADPGNPDGVPYCQRTIPGEQDGAAYVFQHNGSAFERTYTLVPPFPDRMGASGSPRLYGATVAVSGDKLIVGAPGDQSDGPMTVVPRDAEAPGSVGLPVGAVFVYTVAP